MDGEKTQRKLIGRQTSRRKNKRKFIQKIQKDANVNQNLFHIDMKLNMFLATHRPSSGA
jgi:hypothetical protein